MMARSAYATSLGKLLEHWVDLSDDQAGLGASQVTGLGLDSRQLAPGEVFVAIRGHSSHGLEHAEKALEAGAVAVLVDSEDAPASTGRDNRIIAFERLECRLGDLARRFWHDPVAHLKIHGITGTNGKSSCAWMIAQATGGAMIGTLGIGRPGELAESSHTTPDILSLYRALAGLRDAGVEQVALEVSSHALDQDRIHGLAFDTVVFTNLGEDHRDYHSSPGGYGEAKARLFSDYPARRLLINADDEFGRSLIREHKETPGLWRYSLDVDDSVELSARVTSSDINGQELQIETPAGRFTLGTRMLGRFNGANLLVTAGILASQGVAVEEIRKRLADVEPVPGRMNRLPGRGRQPDVVIDYAHSPDSLEQVLAALASICEGKLWCVFGCGGERDREKRPRMGAVVERVADRILLTDDNPRGEDGLAIIRQIQSGMARPDRARVIRDRARAIETAIDEAGPDDLILVAGKGHETYQEIEGRRIPFSDFQVVSRIREEAA